MENITHQTLNTQLIELIDSALSNLINSERIDLAINDLLNAESLLAQEKPYNSIAYVARGNEIQL